MNTVEPRIETEILAYGKEKVNQLQKHIDANLRFYKLEPGYKFTIINRPSGYITIELYAVQQKYVKSDIGYLFDTEKFPELISEMLDRLKLPQRL